MKFEHLYCEELQDGAMVVAAVARYLDLYNAVRPHETRGQRTPLTVWRAADQTPIAKLSSTEAVSLT